MCTQRRHFENSEMVNWVNIIQKFEDTLNIMETPKLGVAPILWLNFSFTKTRKIRTGRTQSKNVFDPLRVLKFNKMDATPSFGVSMDIGSAC